MGSHRRNRTATVRRSAAVTAVVAVLVSVGFALVAPGAGDRTTASPAPEAVRARAAATVTRDRSTTHRVRRPAAVRKGHGLRATHRGRHHTRHRVHVHPRPETAPEPVAPTVTPAGAAPAEAAPAEAAPAEAMIADGSADRGSVTPTVAADTAAPGAPADAAAAGFVTRDGTSLSLDGAPFRFAGTNMYWLALDDNTPTVSYPTGFEIRDAMLTAKALGDTVVRAWADTVGCALCIEPTLGTFNASAFQSLDYAVFVAARLGLHLVLTLADNWAYYNGGKLTYTNWRGVGESAFFTDPTVIGDYESFISEVLNHVNPYTGVAYDQDPTIMAWETGNEVWCQTCGSSQDADEASWTTTISSYIKSLAPDQLVVDGLGVSPDCVSDCLNTAAMAAPDVDIVDDHFYPMLDARVDDASAEAASYGKAYMIGEYDWDGHDPGGDSLASFLSTVENSSTVGDLFWVLIPHDSTTGFQDHNDGFQFDFADSSPTMLADITALRDHAYVMAGTAVPPAPIAPQARMYPPTGPAGAIDVTWRGSFGAVSYTIESSDDGGATWTVAATGVTDGLDDAASPGWTDPDGTPTTLYRMTSVNLDGVTSGWTLPVGESAGS